jgi:cytochrome c biogenesis protein CcmG/thiol:disulfide interchange protein DsbE
VRADTRKHGGILLGILAVAIAVAAAIAALTAGDDNGTASGGTATSMPPGMHTDHGADHPPSVQHGAPGPGVVAPAFDVARLRGPGRVRLADYAGRPVVLTFWASWCISCRSEFPRLRELVQSHRGDDLAVIGITYRDLAADSRAFARKFEANFTLAKGGDGDPVAKEYGIRAIPQLYFIGRDGVITRRMFGSPSSAAIDAAVREISRT